MTRQHRMKLASTVLALIFAAAALVALSQLSDRYYTIRPPESLWQLLALRGVVAPAGYLILGGTVAAAALHFCRFRVPILAGVIAVALTLLAFLQTALMLYDGVTTGAVTAPAVEDMPELLRAALYMPLICGSFRFRHRGRARSSRSREANGVVGLRLLAACRLRADAGASAVHHGPPGRMPSSAASSRAAMQ